MTFNTCFSSLLGLDLVFLSQEWIALLKDWRGVLRAYLLIVVAYRRTWALVNTINVHFIRLYIYLDQDFSVLRATQTEQTWSCEQSSYNLKASWKISVWFSISLTTELGSNSEFLCFAFLDKRLKDVFVLWDVNSLWQRLCHWKTGPWFATA